MDLSVPFTTMLRFNARYLEREICIQNVQKHHDTLNNDNSMDYSILSKQKSIHFTLQNRTVDCSDIYRINDNDERKQLFIVSTDHFLNGFETFLPDF